MPRKTRAELEVENEELQGRLDAIRDAVSNVLDDEDEDSDDDADYGDDDDD